MLGRLALGFVVISLLGVGSWGCSDDDATLDDGETSGGEQGCQVGRSQVCPCPGGGVAEQTCVSVGEWGPCACVDGSTTSTSTTGDPTGSSTGGSSCGDGAVDDDEQCDDGNDIDDDDCSTDCVAHCGVMWETPLVGDLPTVSIGSNGDVLVSYLGAGAASNELQPLRARLSAADGAIVDTLDVGPPLTDAESGQATNFGDDTVYSLGVFGVDGSAVEPRLVRVDVVGGIEWTVGVPADLVAGQYEASATSQGDAVVVAEVSVAPGDTDVFVAKYDGDDGSEIWTTTHTGPTEGGFSIDAGGRVDVAENGDIYVLGRLRKTFNRNEVSLLRFGPDGGAAQWEDVVLPDPGNNTDVFMESLALGPQGAVAVGMTAVISGVPRMRVVRYTDETQTSVVDDTMVGIDNDALTAVRVVLDGDGSLAIVGGREIDGGAEAFIARYDSSGRQLCAEVLGTPGGAYTVASYPDGRIVYAETGMPSRVVMVRP